MQQIYRRTLMLKCDFSKVALQLNLLHIFRTKFPKKICGGLRRKRLILDKVEPLDYVKRNN